jgi:hypothetical protein
VSIAAASPNDASAGKSLRWKRFIGAGMPDLVQYQ